MNNDILARYEQAQALSQGLMSNRIAINDAVFPHWIEDSASFWYIRETKEGKEFRLVDAEDTTNVLSFNHKSLADALSIEVSETVDYRNLPIKEVVITLSPLTIDFQAFDKHWIYSSNILSRKKVDVVRKGLISPEGGNRIFVREYNLWIENQASGEEKALTQDGTADCAYGSGQFDHIFGQGAPHGAWSPDSKRLLTIKLDIRNVVTRPYVQYVPEENSIHPNLTLTKMAYPGDEHVEMYHLVVIDLETDKLQEVDYGPLPFSGYGKGFFGSKPMGWWSLDNRHAYFVDVTRGAKAVRVVELDTYTGSTRVLFEEISDTFVKLCHSSEDLPLFLPLPESNELIWFSERSGWGHLYLYDLTTGELKHPITEGNWLVREMLDYDVSSREVLVQTAARDENINPYYRDICSVNIDSSKLTTLASGCFEHVVYQKHTPTVFLRDAFNLDNIDVNGVSPCGQYIVTTRSRVDTIPVSVMLDREGRELLTIETADVSGLPSGWNWPEPISFKGADNQTDIYGVVFRPPGFSPEQKYPVIDYSNSTRHLSTLPYGSFINGFQFDLNYLSASSFAALGFIVVAMEGRGTPRREKAFQDHRYGDVAATSDFNDRIAFLRQLAERYPYMDLERVGISGIDVIPTPLYGLLNHPEFYKVAVVHAYTDPRYIFAAHGEMYDGISGAGNSEYETQYVEENVESLKGKLMLITGMLEYATPASTFRLVEALRKANKDFDMLCLPNLNTNISPYALRRNWDYLVKHLQGIEPPNEFHLITGEDLLFKDSDLPNLGSPV